jgi:hypothetical protein
MLKFSFPHRIWLGRAQEMRLLEAGLDELVGGRGSLYLVTGEPGIGKTRLADEVSRAATARGVPVHWGRAWEAGGAPPYWPFIQALGTMPGDRETLDRLVTPSVAPIERFQLFAAVARFLDAATGSPRLLVLDDLHAADLSSLELLHFLARDLRARPLMVIGTYREVEARLAPEGGPVLARIAREATALSLGRLGRAEVAEYLVQATGSDPASERVDELYRQTEGNPLFLREVLQLHGSPSRPPEGIREVVRARLALLAGESRRLLECAAVLGREFAVGPLAAVAGVSELEARALVEPAANAAIVEPLDDPPRWRFTHALLRQGLYDDLPAERQAALHRSAAAELARRAGDADLAEIAHHLANAIPAVSPVEAARAALRAADRAMELLAFEDALAFYGRAEALLDRTAGEDGARFDAALGAGIALMRMAEVRRGRAACARAAELARRLGDGERLARTALAAGYEHEPWVRDQARIAELEEALAGLPPGDGPLRALCMAQLASERDPEPDNRPLGQLAREAVAMARRTGDAGVLRATLSAASMAFDSDDRIPISQEMLGLALAAGDKRVALRAHGFLAGGFLERGDPGGVQPHLVAMRALEREFGHGRFRWLAAVLHATDAFSRGDFEEGQRLCRDARASVEDDQARGALMAAAPLAIACITERYEDLAALEASVRAAFGELGHALAGCIGEMLVAQLHGRAGDRARAQAQLAAVAAHPLFEAIEEPSWLALLTDACHQVADRSLADRLHRALRPHAERFAWLGPVAVCLDLPYARHLGLCAQTLGRLDEAVAHLEAAVAIASRAQMRGHLARLWLELAGALLARGGAGDRDRASVLLERARATAAELGQVGLLLAIESAGPRSTGVAPQVAPAPAAFALRREGDVWSIAWGDRTIRLRASRGLAILARLVESPGQELHVLQLASPGGDAIDGGDAGPALDQPAIQSYRQRLLALRDELAEAEEQADSGRAERARGEIDMLTSELSRAVGLGGRTRRTGQAAERARTAVQKRLREALNRIAGELPDLGRHLDQTVRTGIFCGYFPDGRRR